jgi:hypothetical protein
MATWYLGPLRVGQSVARQVGLLGGVAAVAGGLIFGVLTAADPGAVQAAPSAPDAPSAQATPPAASTPASPVATAKRAAPRIPLHQLIAARLLGRRAGTQLPRATQRMLIGRITAFPAGGATVQTASGQVVTIRANAQTRLPPRRLRLGDQVLILGTPQPNGTFLARAVLRRPGLARPAPTREGSAVSTRGARRNPNSGGTALAS